MGEVLGDLLLGNPDETRELVSGPRTLAEVAEERFTDGGRALCRGALASGRGHAASVLHFGPISPRPLADRNSRRVHAVIGDEDV